MSENSGVDQEVPRADLHGGDHHHRAGQVVLPAVVAVAENNHTCVCWGDTLFIVCLLSDQYCQPSILFSQAQLD